MIKILYVKEKKLGSMSSHAGVEEPGWTGSARTRFLKDTHSSWMKTCLNLVVVSPRWLEQQAAIVASLQSCFMDV